MSFTNAELLTLIGITATLIISGWSLAINVRNTKKTLFINSVTEARVKWINSMRNDVALFAGAVYHYRGSKVTPSKREAIEEQIDRLYYSIILRLNPKSEIRIEDTITDLLTQIADNLDQEEDAVDDQIETLVDKVRILLKFEWEIVKREAQHGKLTKETKIEEFKKFQREYAGMFGENFLNS